MELFCEPLWREMAIPGLSSLSLLTFGDAGVPRNKGLRSNSSNLMQFALTKGAL